MLGRLVNTVAKFAQSDRRLQLFSGVFIPLAVQYIGLSNMFYNFISSLVLHLLSINKQRFSRLNKEKKIKRFVKSVMAHRFVFHRHLIMCMFIRWGLLLVFRDRRFPGSRRMLHLY